MRDRDEIGFVAEAKRVVDQKVKLPEGCAHRVGRRVRAPSCGPRRRCESSFRPSSLLIFVILYLTYNDLADALLMMLAVPGALAGGAIFQWLFGFNFSVAVWVGYIACFGMAIETGIIMLVYLREAIESAAA